ncbi:MAG: hypothetical protein R3B90_17310 [Planctomycetaceae bacterium]
MLPIVIALVAVVLSIVGLTIQIVAARRALEMIAEHMTGQSTNG